MKKKPTYVDDMVPGQLLFVKMLTYVDEHNVDLFYPRFVVAVDQTRALIINESTTCWLNHEFFNPALCFKTVPE